MEIRHWDTANIITYTNPDLRPIIQNLFDERDRMKHEQVLEVLDKVHKKYGTRVLKIAAQGTGKKWALKSEYLSKQYTTNPDDFIAIN